MNNLQNIILQHKKILFIMVPVSLLAVLFMLESIRPKNQISTPSIVAPSPLSESAEDSKVPNVAYDKAAVSKLRDKYINRQPLSTEDSEAKQAIIETRNIRSGEIYKTDEYLIKYIEPADQFMVEITTINVGNAKKDAALWFSKEGLSSAGICNLPVVFYINSSIAEQLRPLNLKFNPLPDGC